MVTHVLIVDDESKFADLAALVLREDGYRVSVCYSAAEALCNLERARPDAVVSDLNLGDGSGLDVLRGARGLSPPAQVVLMTAFATVESAIEAMKLGAADYLIKPFGWAALKAKLAAVLPKTAAMAPGTRGGLVGDSPAMAKVRRLIAQVAPAPATVLIRGESGCGKEVVARAIVAASARAAKPYVQFNCTAVPETLLESTLFGHERGAFTGAEARRVGILEAANGGTLLLDEIGDMGPGAQVKLLRVLQEKRFHRVGSTQAIDVDVRIIAATNRDLEGAMKAKTFREDLFFRLNVFPIVIPPLRERVEDIGSLCDHFLALHGHPPGKIGAEARALMARYHWPGNVRELENLIERALILAGEGPVAPGHLPFAETTAVASPVSESLAGTSLEEAEYKLILEAIERAGGNKSRAAELLGITRRRLYSRLQVLERGRAGGGPQGQEPGEEPST